MLAFSFWKLTGARRCRPLMGPRLGIHGQPAETLFHPVKVAAGECNQLEYPTF